MKKLKTCFVGLLTISILLAIVLADYFKPVWLFFEIDKWKIQGAKMEKTANGFLVRGDKKTSEVELKYGFKNPIKLDSKKLDSFLFRMRFLSQDIEDFKIQLRSNNQTDEYAEWPMEQYSERMGIDATNLTSWQNYRLPIRWAKDHRFDPSKVTELVISYIIEFASDQPQIEIEPPKLFSRLPLPCPVFFNDPRVKGTNYSYANRSGLPIFSLTIKQEYSDKLDADLPGSGREAVPASFVDEEGKIYDVSVHYRGDQAIHFEYQKKSWRIIFSKKDKYRDKIKQLNLIIPKTNHYGLEVPYQVAEKMNLLAPESESVRWIMNGVDMGSYDAVEQIDDQFLMNRDLNSGVLYFGDWEFNKNYDKLSPLFESKDHWEVKQVLNYDLDTKKDPLDKLLEIVSLPMVRFENEIETILDVEAYLRWYAFYNLFNSVHNDNFHNVKFFYNADRLLFEPIVWDVNPNSAIEVDLEPLSRSFSNNLLTHKLFQIPRFVLLRDKYFYQYAKELFNQEKFREKLFETIQKTRDDFLHDPFILPSEQKRYDLIAEDFERRIIDHTERIIKELENPEVIICKNENSEVEVQLNSESLVQLGQIVFQADYESILREDNLYDIGVAHREQLNFLPTKFKLEWLTTVINPVTEEVVYQPGDFDSLGDCND